MSKRSNKLLLEDILEAIEKIQRYTNELDFEAVKCMDFEDWARQKATR